MQSGIQYGADPQMNSAEDIARQQTDMDNAWSDYQSAVVNTYYDSQEKAIQPDGYDQATQDSKKPDTADPDGLEQLKQRFVDQLMTRDYSQEDALKEWQNLVNIYDPRGIAIVTSQLGMNAQLNLDEAKRMADSDKRMSDTAEAGGLALAAAGGLQAAGLGLRYALSQAVKAEAAGERGLVSLWKRVADYLPGGGAVGGEAAAPSASGAAGRGVWDSGPGPRGEALEGALGKNLPSNHPVIDKFENGVATSIKSMDLGVKTYHDPGVITRIGRGYIDKVADFQGSRWARVNIEPENITGRFGRTTRSYGGSAGRTPGVDRIWCTKRSESEDFNDTMKSAAAYKRERKIYLDPKSRTTAGIWIGTGPIIVLEASESPSRKGNCLREVLRRSQEGVPHPTNWDNFASPLLDLAGVRSWSNFAKSAVCCSVYLEGDQLKLVPSRNLGARGGYVPIQDRKMAISYDASNEELGLLLDKAFEASE